MNFGYINKHCICFINKLKTTSKNGSITIKLVKNAVEKYNCIKQLCVKHLMHQKMVKFIARRVCYWKEFLATQIVMLVSKILFIFIV